MYLRIRNKYRETCGGVVVGDPNTFATDSEYYSSPVSGRYSDIDKHTHTDIYIYIILVFYYTCIPKPSIYDGMANIS